MEVKDAINKILSEIENQHKGKRRVNYRLRDAGFSRQRYWGEPFPIYYENGIAQLLDENELPLLLPQVESYKPAGAAKSPLSGITEWVNFAPAKTRETDTMPGYAGSSWYFYRYMDVDNNGEFASKAKIDYWQDVDFYIGGTEHAVGHLLYSCMWNKFLYDLNFVPKDEPYKRLVNQGMIQGVSKIVYRVSGTNLFVTKSQKQNYEVTELRVDTKLVKDDVLDIEKFKTWRADFRDAEFILEDGKYFCGSEAEKMSKSKHNTVNPDDVINEYGADCFRMYENVFRSARCQNLGYQGGTECRDFCASCGDYLSMKTELFELIMETPTAAELKILHKTNKKPEKISKNSALIQR
ncbi:MAG: class I tRNA ligase family protein [Bacteroidetes bacterium]|nr:class I tRNA ligase family protein [Bacteroidota bacterium]